MLVDVLTVDVTLVFLTSTVLVGCVNLCKVSTTDFALGRLNELGNVKLEFLRLSFPNILVKELDMDDTMLLGGGWMKLGALVTAPGGILTVLLEAISAGLLMIDDVLVPMMLRPVARPLFTNEVIVGVLAVLVDTVLMEGVVARLARPLANVVRLLIEEPW